MTYMYVLRTISHFIKFQNDSIMKKTGKLNVLKKRKVEKICNKKIGQLLIPLTTCT